MFNSSSTRTFSALRHPNFKLWFGGQIVSLVGTWMQATAQGYLLYELTGSPILLGVAGFANGIPVWLFSLFSGLLADRISRRKIIFMTQASMMVLACILAILVFTDTVQPWHIIILAFLLGVANAFDAPARQSFVVDLVGKEDLTNAIALNSGVFNLGVVVGPTIAALIYAWLGPAWCFTINAISFIPLLLGLLAMRLTENIYIHRTQSPVKNLMEGVRFSFGEKHTRILMINLASFSLFGFSLLTLMPVWATTILGGDVRTNGLLLSARGLGSLAGALMIAYLGSRIARGRIWVAGGLTMPIALLFFAIFPVLPVSLLMLVVAGWALMSLVNITNALVQTRVPDDLRGRVMSVYILVFQGSYPIGALLIGWLASALDPTSAVLICSCATLLIVVFSQLLQPSMRDLA